MYLLKVRNSSTTIVTGNIPKNFNERELESRQSEQPRDNLAHCECDDYIKLLFSRLISHDDEIFDRALNLSLVCKKFREMASYAMLEFIKSQYNPKALFSGRVNMLFSQEKSQVPTCFTATYKQKAIELYCFALRNLNEKACDVYVSIYEQHVKTLLGLYEDFNFKKNADPKGFYLFHPVQGGEDKDELTMNDYVFYKFLDNFFLSSKFVELINSDDDSIAEKYISIVRFLAKKKNLQDVKALIYLLIDQLSNNKLILEESYLFGIYILSCFNLVKKRFATSCISRLHQDLTNFDLTDRERCDWRQSRILMILNNFLLNDLLNHEEIKIFLGDIEEFIKKLHSEEVKNRAIRLCGLLISKKIIIEKEIVSNWTEIVIERFENSQCISIQCASLYFLHSIIEEHLDFKTIENLIKKVAEFLTNSHQTLGAEARKSACFIIQSFAKRDWGATENSLVLLNAFIKVLSGEENQIYEKIFKLCNKLIETNLIENMDESIKKQLLEIAKKNLKNENKVIRINAEKLYALLEDKKLQLNRIFLGILEKYENSEQPSQNFPVLALSQFFSNFENNVAGLSEAVLAVIAKHISESEIKEKS